MKKTIFLLSLLLCFTLQSIAQFSIVLSFETVSGIGSVTFGTPYFDGTYIYATTPNGGANNVGTIIKVRPDGTGYSKLIEFVGGANGRNPRGPLISDGTFLYGMARGGGNGGAGTIFKIMPDGSGFQKIFDFNTTNSGYYPEGALISDGTYLYGTTSYGGINTFGTIFKIKPDGTDYTVLFNFDDTTSGSYPNCTLFSDGTYFYGTTAGNLASVGGSLFKIKKDGTGYINLQKFNGGANGGVPFGNLISDGNFLFGTTFKGGIHDSGTVFKIKTDGTSFTKLIDYGTATTNSIFPIGSLTTDGTYLYGTTNTSSNGYGTLFKLKKDGTAFSTIHNFDGTSTGGLPGNGFIQIGSALYGMMSVGGANAGGAIFKFEGLPTSIKDNKLTPNHSIYPNPNNGNFTIHLADNLENAQVKIYSMLGEIMYSSKLSTEFTSLNTNLKTGLYYVVVEDGKQRSTQKIVVE
jgi:uncharacterized repeat protein (TIGR03803 family)